MTAAQKEILAKAREKAAEKRRQIGEITRISKEKKEAEFQSALAKAREDKAALAAPPKSAAKSAAKPSRKKAPVQAVPSSEDPTSESESEEETCFSPRPRRPRQEPAAGRAQRAGASKNPQRDAAAVARERLQQKMHEEVRRLAWAAIFPGMT
jgi:hypothetical protein